MKTIAFGIQKGGTGKTSISGSIADNIARKGKRTIIIDGDPQGNISSWFLTESPKFELADTLMDRCNLKDAIIDISPSLSIIPTFGLNEELSLYGETQLTQNPFVFQELTELLGEQGFDICIFDLSPGFSQLERCIILACEEVIIPLTPEYFSLDGVDIFHTKLNKLNKRFRGNTVLKKVVCNGFNKSMTIHKDVLETYSKSDYRLFTVPTDTIFKYAQTTNKSVFDEIKYDKSKYTIKEETKKSLNDLTMSLLEV